MGKSNSVWNTEANLCGYDLEEFYQVLGSFLFHFVVYCLFGVDLSSAFYCADEKCGTLEPIVLILKLRGFSGMVSSRLWVVLLLSNLLSGGN